MAKKQQNTLKVSLGAKPVLFVLVALIAAGLTWQFFTAPARARAHDSEAARTAAESTLTANSAELARLEDGGPTKARQALKRVRELDEALPAQVDKVGFAADIAGLAQSHGVTVTQMDPAASDASTAGAAPSATTPPSTTPTSAAPGEATPSASPAPVRRTVTPSVVFNAGISGSDNAMTAFVRDLQGSSPVMTVENLKYNATGEAGAATMQFTLKVWSADGIPTISE